MDPRRSRPRIRAENNCRCHHIDPSAHTNIAISGGAAGGHGHSKAREYQTAHTTSTTKSNEPSKTSQPLSGSSSGCLAPWEYNEEQLFFRLDSGPARPVRAAG
jgi:hypothetical protein